ncbi:MAG: hypothetical protein V3575_04510, partial [Candidatus Absconditabacteria bacterium]
ALIYSFKFIEGVLVKLGKFESSMKGRLQEKFVKYCYICNNNPNISLKELLEIDYDTIIPDSEFNYQIEKFLAEKTLLKNMKLTTINDPKRYNTNFNNLKNFIILGIIKHILISLNKLYDIKGTLTTSLSPWKSIQLSGNEYFCSEFVSEALLYAGVYPFDIETKDPQSITPGDIMDSNTIFVGNETSFFKFFDKAHNGELVEEVSPKEFIFFKNYIIENERGNFYFIKKKLFIEIFDNILKLIANSIRNSYVEKNPYISFRPVFRLLLSLGILLVIGLLYIFVFSNANLLADIHTDASLQSALSNNYLIKLLIIFIHFIMGILIFLILIYLIIFYLIPFIRLLNVWIYRLLFKSK